MYTHPPTWEWIPGPKDYTAPAPAMPTPTQAELRAAFADALKRAGYCGFVRTDASAIRAAVEVVLGDPARDTLRPTTARHRAAFLRLADAIQGGD